MTFDWSGSLLLGQSYRVQLQHTDSGFTLESPLLTESVWMTILPAERFGEWYWEVAVISNNITRTASNKWHFYLDPFSPSNPTPASPTATTTPTAVLPLLPPSTNTPMPPSPTSTPTIVVVTLPVPE
jgi:hypothetical protein